MRLGVDQFTHRPLHVRKAYGTDLALALGDDVGWRQLVQQLDIDTVNRQRLGNEAAHLVVNQAAGRAGIDFRRRANRHLRHRCGKVALVGTTHQLRLESERGDDFGGAGNERYDALLRHR